VEWVSLLLTIIGVVVAIYALRHEKGKRKALAIQVLSEGSARGDDGPPDHGDASGSKTIKLLVRNSGTQPILVTDFEEPLTMRFAGEARVHRATVGRTIPPNLKITATTTDMELSVAPLLLNPRDSFEVDAIVENYSGVTPGGRIVGIPNIDVVQWQGSTPEVFTRRIQGFTTTYVRDPRVTRALDSAERYFDILPPLRTRKNPLVAVLLGFLAGGLGLGIYFRSWLDFALVFTPGFLLVLQFPDAWWVFSLFEATYGYLRVVNSNRRLSPSVLLNDDSGLRPESV
jgi:hypothetical protein